MTELTDAAYGAHAVIGPEMPSFEQELCDDSSRDDKLRHFAKLICVSPNYRRKSKPSREWEIRFKAPAWYRVSNDARGQEHPS